MNLRFVALLLLVSQAQAQPETEEPEEAPLTDEEMFNRLDHDGDGGIDPWEAANTGHLNDWYKKIEDRTRHHDLMDEHMKKPDNEHFAHPELKAEIDAAFLELDKNKDGRIDANEYKSGRGLRNHLTNNDKHLEL